VNAIRGMMSVGMVVGVVTLIGVWLSTESSAQVADRPSIAGAWTMNKNLSDASGGGEQATDDGARRGGGRRGGGFGRGGGGFGRGGGGGYGRGTGTGAAGNLSPDEAARMRDAMRDVMEPPEHLVITETDSMVVLTSADGRTTRLSPDGKSVKDDNTKVERKTKWDAGKLVCEINGLGPRKMTQTFAINPELHQLRVTVQVDGSGQTKARTVTHVYDADKPDGR